MAAWVTKMMPKEIQIALDIILQRVMDDGGFSARNGGPFRPDASAWAILALEASGEGTRVVMSARTRLAAAQLADGRVPMAAHLPEAYWPTPLAILAWGSDPAWELPRKKASQFLLSVGGVTLPYDGDPTQGHDSSIKGWAWVEGTYSWIVPSSLALMALACSGYRNHPRASEAVRLLLNRQIPSGGWNYGDTYAFGTELLPVPETTGHALTALSGAVAPATVQQSLSYLSETLPRLTSPLSLSWAILGLDAWSQPTAAARGQILESIGLQRRYGTYDTDLLAQLVVAFFNSGAPFCAA